MKRVILIVMDSYGAGEAPDAAQYGDAGADTFLHVAEGTPGFQIPSLCRLGLGNVDGIGAGKWRVPTGEIEGAYGRMKEASSGKDTITGHWEIAGIRTETPFRTYPDGFPPAFIHKLEEEIGTEVLGNYPASGTEIIEVLGDEHERTGKPIVYTSADSVFQIAANTAVIPLDRLYAICETARRLLVGDWACGRVIARPYVKENGKRIRTGDRRDYAVSPHSRTMLDEVKAAGLPVYAVGKIHDIFNGQGITRWVHTADNQNGVDETLQAMDESEGGLIFTNLVDFDSKYGHRRDPSGYGRAVMDFDRRLPEIREKLLPEDILIITADHGNDPIHSGFDHTREYVPVLVSGQPVRPGVNLGTRSTFSDLGQTVCDYLGVKPVMEGISFLPEVLLRENPEK